MQNFVDTGQDYRYTLQSGETALKSGSFVLVGTDVGVISVLLRNGNTVFTNQASAAGDIAIVKVEGTYACPKAPGQAWAQGANLYWDDTAKNFTTTVGSNTLAGKAESAALSADTTGAIRLDE